jgi:hypothetical protein
MIRVTYIRQFCINLNLELRPSDNYILPASSPEGFDLTFESIFRDNYQNLIRVKTGTSLDHFLWVVVWGRVRGEEKEF